MLKLIRSSLCDSRNQKDFWWHLNFKFSWHRRNLHQFRWLIQGVLFIWKYLEKWWRHLSMTYGRSLPIFSAVSRFCNFPPDLPNSKNLLNFFLSISVFRLSKLACSKVTRRTADGKHLAFSFFSTFFLLTYSIQRWIQNPFRYLKMVFEWLKAFNYLKLRSSCLTGIWICLCNIMILHSSIDHSIKPPLQPRLLATNYMNFVFRGLFSRLMQDKMIWGGITYVVPTVNTKKHFLRMMKIPGLSDALPTLFSKYIFCNIATWTVWYDDVILSTTNDHFIFLIYFDLKWM